MMALKNWRKSVLIDVRVDLENLLITS